MKILFVTPFLASPPRFGAERRLDGLARELSRQNQVSILWFNADNAPVPEGLQQNHGYCREIATVLPVPPRTNQRRMLQLRSLLSVRSFEALQAAQRGDFVDVLQRMQRAECYDVIQFESLRVASFARACAAGRAPLLVLDEHNIEYDLLKRASRSSGSPLRRLYNELNWRKMAREERAAWQEFDGVAVTSLRDRSLLELPPERSAVIPNGVDLAAFPLAPRSCVAGQLLFFGALNYFPNQQGLTQFIDHTLPRIRRGEPRARLLVVGPGAPESIRRRQSASVELIGEVKDVGPYLDAAAAVVVPVTIGGGTRLKIIEALAKGKAVISTQVGAEGLGVVHGRHLLLADDPAHFAREVIRVLQDPELAARLGTAGRAHVEEHYDWRRIAADLEAFYERLASARARRTGAGALHGSTRKC